MEYEIEQVEEIEELELEPTEEVEEEAEADELETDDFEESEEGEPEEEDSEEDPEDELIVSIDGESPPPEEEQKAPQWVRDLRKKSREDQKKIRELEAQLGNKAEAPRKELPTLGDKPTMDSCDLDADLYDEELAKWYRDKAAYDKAQSELKAEEEKAKQTWQATLDEYGKKKSDLKVSDYEEVEAFVEDTLSVTQQGMIIQGAENPALLFYAIGKNPKKAEELKNITDPVKFAFAVSKLETKLKVSNRKAVTKPEKTISGSSRTSGAVDSAMKKLRDEANKTGNFDKLLAYKRKLKAKN